MTYSFAGNAATDTASIFIILVTEVHIDFGVKRYNLLAFNNLNVWCLEVKFTIKFSYSCLIDIVVEDDFYEYKNIRIL